jgi:selenium metabolism protein YedF
MRIEVDARGLACPQPVIKTKKELDNIKSGIVITVVDNEIAKENILKLAKSMNYDVSHNKKDEMFYIEIKKGEGDIVIKEIPKQNIDDRTIYISSDKMGKGNDELGEVLIKGFIYTLTEVKPYPKNIIFVNSGVKLATVNEATVENLKILEEYGVNIISCGTCLDYYDVKDKLQVGSITNMYNIVEIFTNSQNTISI